jgi:tetratricopeptide (TPR) repeat protein
MAGVTAWRRVRAAARDQRPAVAAAVATFAAFAVAAGLDWMWELPAVTAVGVLALALVTGPATGVEAQAAKRRGKRYILARLGFVGVALAVVVSQMIPLLAQSDIQSSQSAAGRGDVSAALSRAHDARDWQPWAASPRLQEALVQEQAGHLQAARTAIEAAIARDRSDWHLWVVAARIDARMGARAAGLESLAEAKRLNPRSKAVEASERELTPVLKSSQ